MALSSEWRSAPLGRRRCSSMRGTFYIAGILLCTAVAAQAADQLSLHVVLSGQSIVQTDIRENPDVIAAIKPLLKGDVVFTNYEAAIANKGEEPDAKAHVAFGPPEAMDVLKELGFNLVALSNNHSYDLGQKGLLNTLREVTVKELSHAGIGANLREAAAPGYLHTQKGTIALVSMASGMIEPGAMAGPSRPGVNEIRLVGRNPGVEAGHPDPEDALRILHSIKKAAKHADLVIAYQHNHAYTADFTTMMMEEFSERLAPPEWIRTWAHEEVDAGADIVVLHGAPLLQGVEIYHGRVIFYDLGNFIFQTRGPIGFEPIVYESVVVHADYDGQTLKSLTFHPIVLSMWRDEGPASLAHSGQPRPAPPERASYILKRFAEACHKLGTSVEISGDVAKLKLSN